MTLEDRLISWGEWSRRTGRSQQRAGSYEGDYRSPQPWDDVPVPSAITIRPDDCRLIELAWSTLEPADKVFLRAVYCKRYGRKHTLFLVGGVLSKHLAHNDWTWIYPQAHEAIDRALLRGEDRNHGILMALGKAVLGLDPMRMALEA